MTMLGVNLALSIASKFTGYTPVFPKPDWIFTTVIAQFQAGEKTSQKRFLGKHFALVSKFHWLKYLCHSFLNWAKGVESSACTMWLVCGGGGGGIAITCIFISFIKSKKATLYTWLLWESTIKR